MGQKCEVCGAKLADKTDRFCPGHAIRHLKKIAESGYFQPLTYRTQDGEVVLSRSQFLTIHPPEAEPETEASEPN